MNTMKSATTSANVNNSQLSTANPMAEYRGLLRAAALCALTLLSFPLLSSAQTTTDQIRLNRDIGKCWQKSEDGLNNGNIIHLWDCALGQVGNKTFFYDRSTGFIRHSLNPSKCIHKQTTGWKLGDILHLWDCADGQEENKTFDYDDNDGRIRFRFNPEFCAGTKFIGKDNGNPIVVAQCRFAESYSIAGSKSDSTSAQGGVPCSNVRLASQKLVLEVKTGNLQGAGSSATMMIRIVFDDWDTGEFALNDRSFFADGLEVIDTGIEIPGGCNRKGTNMKSWVIENKGSNSVFSADAWHLESICARSSLDSSCSNPVTVNRWINGGGRLTWGLK